MSVALAIGVTAGFGVRFIGELGTKEQKEKYLPLIGRGQIQDLHGTDRTCRRDGYSGGSINTSAEDKGDRWVINGQKIFITGAHVADSLITVCKTEKDAKKSKSLDHHHGAARDPRHYHP